MFPLWRYHSGLNDFGVHPRWVFSGGQASPVQLVEVVGVSQRADRADSWDLVAAIVKTNQ